MTSRPAAIDLLGRNALAAGLYALLGLITLLVIGPMTGISLPVWPSAGVAFALVYLWDWRVLPGIAVGTFAYTAFSLGLTGESASAVWSIAAAVGVGAAVQAQVGAALVRRFVGQHVPLEAPREIIGMLLLAGPLSCLLSPTIAITAEIALGIIVQDRAALGWITWWAGDAIGVVVFAPIALLFAPGLRRTEGARRWKVLLPSLVIVAGLSSVLLQDAAIERAEAQRQVERLANEAAADLKSNITRHEEVLHSIVGLQGSSLALTAQDFKAFTTGPLARFPNLHALSWNPLVRREDLPAFEAALRTQPGLESYSVTERDASGELRPVAPRDEYVAIQYIEPIEKNRLARGFDIMSNPTRAEAIQAARDTGETRATAPIDLVQETGAQKGMLVLLPVFAEGARLGDAASRRAALRGFAVAAYRLGDLLKETFSSSAWNHTNIRLVDVTDGAPADIAELPAREKPTVDSMSAAPSAVVVPLEVYGRTWQVQVTPTSGPLTELNVPRTVVLLLVAVLVVFLLQAFVLLLTGFEQNARQEAAESSHAANHDALTGLLNRREFVRQLQRALERGRETSGAVILLFCDLDGFKLVNDRAGHEAGDHVLVAVASALRRAVGGHGLVARLGGDEFAVVLADCPPERGLAIADSIIENVSKCVVHSGDLQLSVGVSVGVTVVDPLFPADLDALMRQADTACYAAKAAGRGSVRIFAQGMTAPGRAT